MEFTGARVVALADPFDAQMEGLSQKLKVSSPRKYAGIEGFRELLQSRVDAVVITSPPYFHPEQTEAALAAGKHVYLAKPMAVDVPGCRRIVAAGEKAAGKHSLWIDWQTRMSTSFREAAARVHAGDVGAPVVASAGFHARRLPRQDQPGMTAQQARLRNWVFDKALSGDILVEQNIHCLDVINWFLNTHPEKAFGTGGRKARTDIGDCWDHYVLTYWYPGGVKLDFTAMQFLKGGNRIFSNIYGSNGTIFAQYNGALSIAGDKPWKGVEKDETMRSTAENVKLFSEAVRSGKVVNNASVSAESTYTAILGRMAAEREQILTWDEMLRVNERLDPKLSR
jgi:predicted dehydrogenase